MEKIFAIILLFLTQKRRILKLYLTEVAVKPCQPDNFEFHKSV